MAEIQHLIQFQPLRNFSGPNPIQHHQSPHRDLQIPVGDTFSWNALIRSHLADGDPRRAALVYREMILRGARPDKHTIPRVISAARRSASFSTGKQVHCHALKLGLASDGYVVTALMELYGEFDGAAASSVLFKVSPVKNSVSWTVLMKMYLAEDKPCAALQVFNQMFESGCACDSVALVTALNSCGKLKSFHEGKKVHHIAREIGLEADVLVANALVKMYIECSRLDDARRVFDKMSFRDDLTWTTLIGAYVKKGCFNEGLKLFHRMIEEGLKPDCFAATAVLPACARMAAHKNGKGVHAYIVRHGIEMNVTVQNALMDMYIKSGNIDYARKIFKFMVDKDVISWTVMILGYSLYRHSELGVELFHEMVSKQSATMDGIFLSAALWACGVAGLVDEGKHIFELIKEPQLHDFASMAGLLSRAGFFPEAREFVQEHHIGSQAAVIRAMLDGCRIHRNLSLGKRLAEQLIELEPLNAENYVLLSNYYASMGKLDKAKEVREIITDMALKTKKAYSWIEVGNKVHAFGVGDVSHPRSERLYWELQGLKRKMEESGNALEMDDFSLHDVDEERECILQGHSELLAIAFGLISTRSCTVLRVSKNLRVCRGCHAMAKMISEIADREIVLKDPYCFHHFKNGSCSCRDMW